MVAAFGWTAVALAVGVALTVSVLAFRRVQVTRGERRQRETDERLRPLALALADGAPVDSVALSRRDTEALARLLARYARWLTGDARAHIARFFEDNGNLEREISALRHRRAWRRATAAFALGDMASTRAVPALLAALGDADREVRSAAARSLGRLGAGAASSPLVLALVERRIPRAVAGQALLTIGPAALDGVAALVDHEEADVRAAAVELVGFLGDAAYATLIAGRLRDPAAEVRAKAARALGRLGAEDAAAALRSALADRIAFVRTNAAHALGMVGDRDAVLDLVLVARGDDFDAAQAAAYAVGRISPAALRAAAAPPAAGPHLHEAADVLAAGST